MGGPGGPAFTVINPQQVPALSAQHWQIINRSLQRSPSALGGLPDGDTSYISISSDDDSCDNHDVISLSSTITSSSATSIASKTHLDLLNCQINLPSDDIREVQDRNDDRNTKESTPPGESMRKKLRPRRAFVQNQKRCRKTKKEPETPVQEEVDNTPVVTASLAMIPIPENFDGVNNPFYAEEETSQLCHLPTYSVEFQPAPVKIWKVQPRDLVFNKDGSVRCRRTRRRHSAKTVTTAAAAASAAAAVAAASTKKCVPPSEEVLEQPSTSAQNSKDPQPSTSKESSENAKVSNYDNVKRVEFKGEKTLLRMAFPEVLAYRKLLDGTTQILVRRTKSSR